MDIKAKITITVEFEGQASQTITLAADEFSVENELREITPWPNDSLQQFRQYEATGRETVRIVGRRLQAGDPAPESPAQG